jgi:hypothetical protein
LMTANANGTSATLRFVAAERSDPFDGLIERWTREALARSPSGYRELLRTLPGVDPVLLAPILELLEGDPVLGPRCRELAAQSREDHAAPGPPTERPVPHPLEYYWANDWRSLDLLAARLARSTEPGDRVLYLGAPNVFRHASALLPDREHTLLDASRARTEALAQSLSEQVAIICVDLLGGELPDLTAQTVIMDPPWYPEHLESFLWAAVALAAPGASLMCSYPPAGTRPGIGVERAEFLDWAHGLGIELTADAPGLLGYLSPAFERSAYAAAGLPGVSADWRTGDLLTFKVSPGLGLPSIPRPTVGDHEQWTHYNVREIPIWVRSHARAAEEPINIGDGTPLLESIVTGDVLPSVSRREPLRAAVSVWSSRNRVLATSNLPAVHAVCAALQDREDPVFALSARTGGALSTGQLENVASATERLLALANLEREEHMLA